MGIWYIKRKKDDEVRYMTKKVFLDAIFCPRLGWMRRNGKINPQRSWGIEFRKEQGNRVHKIARTLFKDGILIDETDIKLASEKTKELLDNPLPSTIFESAFLTTRYTARADILSRGENGWQLCEVKSNIHDKDEFIDDMAYTAMVLERSGVSISEIVLLLISKDYRLDMENREMFVKIDHSREVQERVQQFKPFWNPIEKVTRPSERPKPRIKFECKKCEIFKQCIEKKVKGNIFELPRLSKKKFNQLNKLGIYKISDIPDDFSLSENQKMIRDCMREKKPFVSRRLQDELGSIKWPAFYLDFETVMTAIPLYYNIAPYTKLPTQYSIHKCLNPGEIIDHREFIADPERDCRRELTERLIHDLESEGSIIVYSGFEKTILKNLSRTFVEFSPPLDKLIERIVDLEAIIRNNFYHPKFKGSTSIKKTVPAMVSNLTYDDLDISDGDSAMAVFGFLALGKYKDRSEEMKKKLLEYCKQDTLATVKLHEKLYSFI
jgi:predicted RecB family nuclease